MREFVSFDYLAQLWKTDQGKIRAAADAAGILCFSLKGKPHADRNDLLRLGDALNRDAKAVA